MGDELRHWFASPRAAVGFFITAAGIDTTPLGVRRSMTMPGVCATVGEEIEALRSAAGDDAVALIKRAAIPSWPRSSRAGPGSYHRRLAGEMGFKAENDFDQIIKVYQEDEMGE